MLKALCHFWYAPGKLPVVQRTCRHYNIFMEHFETLALHLAQYRPPPQFWYADNTSVASAVTGFPQPPQYFWPTIQFTMEILQSNSFLYVLVIRKGWHWSLKSVEISHTSYYLSFKSNHSQHVKRGLIQTLHVRASTICPEWQDTFHEIIHLGYDFELNCNPPRFHWLGY
jgi:hypothetical protein